MGAIRITILFLTVFSIAMGFLESAVVIYLRELYYPDGFKFPLLPIPENIEKVEFSREIATIIMLSTIAGISGKNATQRFSFFLFCFAVWDIFYYVFLKVFLDWPESLLTWDILFLIPSPWFGPVIAPCLASLTMILLTLTIVYFNAKNIQIAISSAEWALLISGAVVMILSFTIDYAQYFLNRGHTLWMLISGQVPEATLNYIPQSFDWLLFGIAELLILTGIATMIKRHRSLLKI